MNTARAPRAKAVEPSLGAPASFDGFVLERLLGRGGMGEVYLARDTLLEREVAIKLIATGVDAEARKRFLVEARAVARLEHPNVVGVYRVGEVGGLPYLASEYVRGTPLDEIERPVDGDMALRIAIDLTSGLATAHRRGVLHRDIKPANVILSDDGPVKLLDFGIAKLLRRSGPPPASPSPSGSAPDVARPRVETTDVTRPALIGKTAETRVDGQPAATDATRELPRELVATRRDDAQRPRRTRGVVAAISEAPSARDNHRRKKMALVDLTRTGVALGTPRYMAPEAWRGEPATFASDVYSVGAMLFTLCAARPVFPTRDIDELRTCVLERDAEPLAPLAPGIDERFCAIVDRCLRRDPKERFESAVRLRAAFSALLPGARDAVVPDGNPYRGLACFEAEHKNLYFGRDSESRLVLDRLARDGFVLVAGDSGVGKSSLCRAGVLPRLDAWLGKDRRWTTVAWVPGPQPVAALAAALAPMLERSEANLAGDILEDPGGVARAVRAKAGKASGILLLVDQLEELVTLAPTEEAAAVSELLGWLALPAPGARLLATARGDFLSRLAQLPRLGDRVGKALFFLRPLSEDRIREAILGPAAAKDVTFGSSDLVDELVASTTQAGDGALPLLQFALAELWEAREGAAAISAETLARVGGVDGALCRHADDVLAGLAPRDREAARRVLVALVSADGTRARKREDELDEDAGAAIAALVRGRLLVARDGPQGARYEIAHEALIAHWQTLRGWLSSNAEARVARERLDAAAAEWERLGRPRDALLSERRLAEIDRLGLALENRHRAFVTDSRRQLRRRRGLRVVTIVAVPLIIASVWLAVLAHERRALDRRIDAHREAAAATMTEMEELERRDEKTRRAALDAFDRAAPNAEDLWAEHLAITARLRKGHGEAAQRLEQALTLDMSRRDVRADFADLLLCQVRLADQRGAHERLDELLRRLAVFDDDGSRRAQWNAPALLVFEPPADVHRYELLDGRLEPQLVARAAKSLTVVPGSYLAVAGSVRLPFLAHRGQRATLTLEPPSMPIPEGFIYVPAGRFLVGSEADDVQRRDFFHAVPRHELATKGYLVARHETTFADWIAFLDDLPADEREAHLPRVGKGGFKGSLALDGEPGAWRLHMQPTTVTFDATAEERITYPGRAVLAHHDWLQLPVVGITSSDAEAYTRWLHRSGRVTGARLCDEREWERAARGADGRPYPHGMTLAPADANHDETYGKRSEAMGPDEVGSHPRSRSPFGAHDMAGNVWEWARSAASPTGFVARGGSWYYGPSSSHVADREETEASFRDVSVGLRVCADAR